MPRDTVRYEAPIIVVSTASLFGGGTLNLLGNDWNNYPRPWLPDVWPGRECLPVHPPTTDPEDC